MYVVLRYTTCVKITLRTIAANKTDVWFNSNTVFDD